MTDRKNFARDFEFSRMILARSAQPALNLSGLEKAALDCELFAAHCGQFVFERADSLAILARAEKLGWVRLFKCEWDIRNFRSRDHAGNLTEPHLVHCEP